MIEEERFERHPLTGFLPANESKSLRPGLQDMRQPADCRNCTLSLSSTASLFFHAAEIRACYRVEYGQVGPEMQKAVIGLCWVGTGLEHRFHEIF
jgi:hypothetical protein